RLLSETKQVRFLHPAPQFVKRGFFQWDRIMPSKHGTPVRIRHPLPMRLRRSMGEDSRLRTEELGFESSRGRHHLHPCISAVAGNFDGSFGFRSGFRLRAQTPAKRLKFESSRRRRNRIAQTERALTS